MSIVAVHVDPRWAWTAVTARKLRIPRVIFPIGAGVMSALGLLVSPLGFEVSRSRRVYVADLDAASLEGFIAPLVEEASGFLHRAGIADPRISVRLNMRYQGQGYESEVTLPDGGNVTGYADHFPRLDDLFRARYAEIFAETFLDEPLEIVRWKVEATGEEAALDYGGIAGGTRAREKRSRDVWFRDTFVECEVLDRYALEPGTTIESPAVIEERESTCVLGPGDRATVDAHLNLVAEFANEESHACAPTQSTRFASPAAPRSRAAASRLISPAPRCPSTGASTCPSATRAPWPATP